MRPSTKELDPNSGNEGEENGEEKKARSLTKQRQKDVFPSFSRVSSPFFSLESHLVGAWSAVGRRGHVRGVFWESA